MTPVATGALFAMLLTQSAFSGLWNVEAGPGAGAGAASATVMQQRATRENADRTMVELRGGRTVFICFPSLFTFQPLLGVL
jgi:hypothetical protein